jgi:hypothetical protein
MTRNPPVCTCRNEGKPWTKDGETYISRDPSCRVHTVSLSFTSTPVSAEAIIGNWKRIRKIEMLVEMGS